ncbi:M48 family metallopeptidase [Halosegnis sp.]|uniref:M48 family metallopeptidase n=1 Tax=Halosegnis sp. TaxID=2864959 RepID=UPI0035D4B034
MRRPAARLLAVVAGAVTLVAYAASAYVVWRGLLFVWRRRPDPLLTVAVVVATTAALGYASYAFGTAGILRSLGADPLSRREMPELYRRLGALSNRLGVDTPTVCVARMEAPNALALGGPSDGVIVLDARLFRLLSARELEAILAHELAHLDARDGLVQTLGATLVSTAAGVVAVVLLPALLLAVGLARAFALARGQDRQMREAATARARAAVGSVAVLLLFGLTVLLRAYSRRRELAADDTAATLTDYPAALASALARIKRATAASGLLSSLYIHGDEEGTLTRLLATHPPMDERIRRLREQAAASDSTVRRIPVQ